MRIKTLISQLSRICRRCLASNTRSKNFKLMLKSNIRKYIANKAARMTKMLIWSRRKHPHPLKLQQKQCHPHKLSQTSSAPWLQFQSKTSKILQKSNTRGKSHPLATRSPSLIRQQHFQGIFWSCSHSLCLPTRSGQSSSTSVRTWPACLTTKFCRCSDSQRGAAWNGTRMSAIPRHAGKVSKGTA